MGKSKYENGTVYEKDGRQVIYLKGVGHIEYARWVWEQNNGPIPIGMAIHHIDQNPLNNDISNLMMLTCAEHSKIHHQLWLKNHPVVFSEETRKKLSEAQTGRVHSEETRKKMSESRKKYLKDISSDKPIKGRIPSEETKKKMSEAKKGKTWEELQGSEEAAEARKELMSKKMKGRPQKKRSEETKENVSNAMKEYFSNEENRKRQSDKMKEYYRTHKNKKVMVVCPYCGKEGVNYIMTRYHFDNCKHKDKE